jgi:hypothetical protein
MNESSLATGPARTPSKEGVARPVAIPRPAIHAEPPPAPRGPDPIQRWKQRSAAYFEKRDVGPAALGYLSLAFSATGGFVFLAGHQGLGACMGVIAFVAGALAAVPPSLPVQVGPTLAVSLLPLGDFLLLAGFFGGLPRRYAPVVVGLAFLVLVVGAWFPLALARANAARPAPVAVLWSRAERMGILLLGAMFGGEVPALLGLLAIQALDLWLHLDRIEPEPLTTRTGSPWARVILGPDGNLKPALRWGTLAATVAAIVLLPQSDAWRF